MWSLVCAEAGHSIENISIVEENILSCASIIKCPCNKILLKGFLLHCKDHLKCQCNLFGRIFVTTFLLETFNFIQYANNTTCYTSWCIITSKITISLESDQHIPNTNGEANSLIIAYALTSAFSSFLLLYATK